jgi:hypothetical protein
MRRTSTISSENIFPDVSELGTVLDYHFTGKHSKRTR